MPFDQNMSRLVIADCDIPHSPRDGIRFFGRTRRRFMGFDVFLTQHEP